MKNKGILYVVPTPIGNLEDITLRAIRILKEVDIIACEDTRITQKLLNRYEIETKTMSYHKFSEKQKSERIIQLIEEGKNIALVSDAGTPIISDPGSELLKIANDKGVKVIPLAGASALTVAISAIGKEKADFYFAGFMPRNKGEKSELLSKYSSTNIITYESPSRLVKSLEEIALFSSEAKISVARELTKIYEEIKTGSVQTILDYYKNNLPKGEIVLIIHSSGKQQSASQNDILEKARLLQREGFSTKEISKIISVLYNLPKKEIYNLLI